MMNNRTKIKIDSLVNKFENTRQTIINSLSDGEYKLNNVDIDGIRVQSIVNGHLYDVHNNECDCIDLLTMDELYLILNNIQ